MITASTRGRRNRKSGQGGELVALHQLRYLGLVEIEPIETGWRIKRSGKRIVGATPTRKVSGDFKALIPGIGRAVHIEVKARPERLIYSDLEAHQIAALDRHHEHGAVSLLVWKWTGGVSVMRWPIAGFEARTSLSIAQAAALNLKPQFWHHNAT